MSTTTKAISCRIIVRINPYHQLIGFTIISPRTGRGIEFGPDSLELVPADIRQRIRDGHDQGEKADFTTAELVQLVEILKAFKPATLATMYRRTNGRGWRNR